MCFILKLLNSCTNSTEKSPRKSSGSSSNNSAGNKSHVSSQQDSKHLRTPITSLTSPKNLSEKRQKKFINTHSKEASAPKDTTLILDGEKVLTYPNSQLLAEFDDDEFEFDKKSIKEKLLYRSRLDSLQSKFASKSSSLTNTLSNHRGFSNVQKLIESNSVTLKSPKHQINLKYRNISDYCNECNYYSCECDLVTTNSTEYNSRSSPISFSGRLAVNDRLSRHSSSANEEKLHNNLTPANSLNNVDNTSIKYLKNPPVSIKALSRNSLNDPATGNNLIVNPLTKESNTDLNPTGESTSAQDLVNNNQQNFNIPIDLISSAFNLSSQSSQTNIDMNKNNSLSRKTANFAENALGSLTASFTGLAQISSVNKNNANLNRGPPIANPSGSLSTPMFEARDGHQTSANPAMPMDRTNSSTKPLPNKFPTMGMTTMQLKQQQASRAEHPSLGLGLNNIKKNKFTFKDSELFATPQDDEDLSRELEKEKKDISRQNKIKQAKGGKITIAPNQVYDFREADLKELGQIGNGEFGTVHKALHTPSQTLMAVKRIGPTVGNQVERKKVLKELDFVLECNENEFVVKFYGVKFNNEPADCLICMELMDTSLEKFYKFVYGVRKEEIPESILGKIAVATVSGLDYLREKHSIIHRDVKPSNMLINKQGEIKMCDFGISGKLVDSIAASRDAGCQLYMAPERIDPSRAGPCHVYDVRSDIWSLGISMYELATGKFPYPSWTNIFKQLSLVVNGEAPRLKPDRLSEQFCSFVNTCLTKDETKRPKYKQLKEHSLYKEHSQSNVNVSEYVSPYVTEMLSATDNK